MRVVALVAVAACGYPKLAPLGGGDDGQMPDACVGLQCQVTHCQMQGKPETSISGTVFAANGTLPLYGVTVYVPNTNPGPFTAGAACTRCSDPLPGSPVAKTTTTELGSFTLPKIPSGDNIPVVVAIGKWRRQITVPHVAECADTPIAAIDTTLPKSRTDLTPNTTSVDLPKIALSTGAADALECLVRKLGIADSEIGTDGSSGAVQLFAETVAGGQGATSFAAGFPGGSGSFGSTDALWKNGTTVQQHADKLRQYDVVILSCEGSQNPTSKLQESLDAMKTYADLGGRVFASHWHNIWIEGAMPPATQVPAVWPAIAQWNNSGGNFGGVDDLIDEVANPTGPQFATWFAGIVPTMRDHIPIEASSGRNTVTSVDPARAVQWTYWPMGPGINLPQNFAFTTPNEAPDAQRCGKVAFSDMHVASGSTSTPATPFPNGCSTTPMTPQELAIAFMIFDLQACVGP